MIKTGKMTTNGLATVKLILPDFDVKRTIKWQFHVDSHNKISNSRYDIIIGRDLLAALGMVMDYKQKQNLWDNASTPMNNWQSDLTYEEAERTTYTTAPQQSRAQRSGRNVTRNPNSRC